MSRSLTPKLDLDDDVPIASHMKVVDCGMKPCDHLHLVAYDDADEPICEIIIPLEAIEQMYLVTRGGRQ